MTIGKRSFKARKVVRGIAFADAIVCPDNFSFMVDVNAATGEIVTEGNPSKGLRLKDRILICKETIASADDCTALLALAIKGIAPSAIVTMQPANYNTTEGASLAEMPFMCVPEADLLTEIKTGDSVCVDANRELIEVLD